MISKELNIIDRVFDIDFVALNESRRIQLQFATNRIKIGPSEPEIQPAKGVQRHYAEPMTSCDAIGLPSETISLVTLYYYFFTAKDYTKDTQEISGTQLPYRRCERGSCHKKKYCIVLKPMTLGDCAITFPTVK